MFWHYYQNPRFGDVYNVSGGRYSNCSMIEAIDACELISGNKMTIAYSEANRIRDQSGMSAMLTNSNRTISAGRGNMV